MAIDTTKPSYWLNWRFFICALYVLATVVIASIVVWKYEGKASLNDEAGDGQQVPVGILYKEEAWKTCLKGIHPAWLLSFRIIAFIVLLTVIISNAIIDGPGIFFFYTQWTFALTTIFFGLASAFSIYGSWYHERGGFHDVERGSYASPQLGGSENTCLLKNFCSQEEVHAHQIAGSMAYLFQIIYQVAAGAVVLTDLVWWLLIYPFLTGKDYRLNFFDVCMHSVNALVVVDTILNDMRFPMFRIAYFIMWTTLFVICQWIIHACISIPWPYPFMELSTPYAPAWYLGVGLLHLPCFGLFAFIVKLKYLWLPDPFQNPLGV